MIVGQSLTEKMKYFIFKYALRSHIISVSSAMLVQGEMNRERHPFFKSIGEYSFEQSDIVIILGEINSNLLNNIIEKKNNASLPQIICVVRDKSIEQSYFFDHGLFENPKKLNPDLIIEENHIDIDRLCQIFEQAKDLYYTKYLSRPQQEGEQ